MTEAIRVALVTGAARGIGAAVVGRLVDAGCHVVAFDSCAGASGETPYPMATRADIDALVARHGDRVVPVVGDVRDRDALSRAVDDAVERWGRLDVAVAAAAVMTGGGALWEVADEELDLMWDVDAKGVWSTAAATVPAMLSGPDPSGCRFVAIASAAGTHGLFHLAAYNAVKHAVVGIVKGLSSDLTGTGVTAAAVSPGSTATRMLEATAALYDVSPADLAAHQRIRRVIQPDEVAATVAFCCSREGAVVNGTVVHADGGFPV